MALLVPPADWRPNLSAARLRLEARQHERRFVFWQSPLTWAVAASLACAVLVASPAVRAAGQQLWQWFTVRHIEVVRIDFDSLPGEARSLRAQPINKPAPPISVRDAEEAARIVGFAPRLPQPAILPEAPQLSTLGPMSFGTVLRTADLELALQKAGVTDERVPKEWDGAELSLQIGPTVTAQWPGITLMQGLPPTISTPAGFDLRAFSTAALRAVGMNRETARRFGERMVNTPFLLLGITTEDKVAIREVNLRTGPATLVDDLGKDGQSERVSLIWSVSDRVYLLSGAIKADSAIEIANATQ